MDATQPLAADEHYGYTAGAWATATAPEGWPMYLQETHSRWGGGRELDRSELIELLGLVFELQTLGDRIAQCLKAQVPEHVDLGVKVERDG